MAEFTRATLPAQEVTRIFGVRAPTARLSPLLLVQSALEVVRLELIDEAITDVAFPVLAEYKTEGQSVSLIAAILSCLISKY